MEKVHRAAISRIFGDRHLEIDPPKPFLDSPFQDLIAGTEEGDCTGYKRRCTANLGRLGQDYDYHILSRPRAGHCDLARAVVGRIDAFALDRDGDAVRVHHCAVGEVESRADSRLECNPVLEGPSVSYGDARIGERLVVEDDGSVDGRQHVRRMADWMIVSASHGMARRSVDGPEWYTSRARPTQRGVSVASICTRADGIEPLSATLTM